MSCAYFENVDDALLPLIFRHVPPQTKAVLPFVCKLFRESCRWVHAEWDFNNFPPQAQYEVLSKPADGLLSFFAFRTTAVTLSPLWMVSALSVGTAVSKFPFLQTLHVGKCYNMRSHEWRPLLNMLAGRKHAPHLQEVVTPWRRLRVTEGTFDPKAIALIQEALLRVLQFDMLNAYERFDNLSDDVGWDYD